MSIPKQVLVFLSWLSLSLSPDSTRPLPRGWWQLAALCHEHKSWVILPIFTFTHNAFLKKALGSRMAKKYINPGLFPYVLYSL